MGRTQSSKKIIYKQHENGFVHPKKIFFLDAKTYLIRYQVIIVKIKFPKHIKTL